MSAIKIKTAPPPKMVKINLFSDREVTESPSMDNCTINDDNHGMEFIQAPCYSNYTSNSCPPFWGSAMPYDYMTMIPQQQQTQLAVYAGKKDIDHFTRKADKSDDLEQKLLLMEKAELLYQRRVLYTDGIYVNQYGQLCQERLNPEKKVIGSTVICSAKDLTMTKFYSLKGSKQFSTLMVTFDDDGTTKSVVLNPETMTPLKFGKELDKIGVRIQSTSDNRKNILGLVYEFLLKNCETVTIPYTKGWQKIDGRWDWITDDILTMRGLKKNEKH